MGGVKVGGWKLEEVDEFKYLGMLVEGKGGTEKEIKNGCETWMINVRPRKSLNVFETKGLRAICKWIDRIRNERIKEMCKWKRGAVDRAEEGVLKLFGHMCRMNEDRMVGKVLRSEVAGGRGRGRPKWRWMDGASEVLGGRNLSLEEGRRLAEDRVRWRAVVKGIER